MTAASLFIQASKLRHENHALPFAETVIRPVAEVTVEPFSRQAAAIMHGTRPSLECVVIRDDHAAFTRRHQFARLKAEGTGNAEGPNALPMPFACVRVGTVLDEPDFPFV